MTSQSVYGAQGYHVVLEKYGKARMDQWRRRGGRKPNPTLAQIEASTAPGRKRPTRNYTRRKPITDRNPIVTRFS